MVGGGGRKQRRVREEGGKGRQRKGSMGKTRREEERNMSKECKIEGKWQVERKDRDTGVYFLTLITKDMAIDFRKT